MEPEERDAILDLQRRLDQAEAQIRLLQHPTPEGDELPGPLAPLFFARRDSTNPKQFIEQEYVEGAWTDKAEGQRRQSTETASEMVEIDSDMAALWELPSLVDGVPTILKVLLAGGAGTPFVRVTSDGGSAGVNQTSPCTYTYTVKDITNTDTLGSAVALTGNGNGWRGLNIVLTAATYGAGYWDDDTFVLLWVDEKPASEQDCEVA